MLFSSAINAEQKPYAPETIDDVTIVSAEQVIDMILANPEMIVIDTRKPGDLHRTAKRLVKEINTRTSLFSDHFAHNQPF